jgi:4-hydroxy-3-polyprenylbenzoate decarboxylase
MIAPLIVGISGASGAIYGIEALRALKEIRHPVHLIVSEMGQRTIGIETDYTMDEVRALAQETYSNKDLAAAVSSGSFRTGGMLIAPCSIKTLSGIANSFSYNLMIRAADVTLKEKKSLVLMLRETPLHKGHLEAMIKTTELGAIIHPPVPAFYNKPQSIEEIVRQSVGRALDHLGIEHELLARWQGA